MKGKVVAVPILAGFAILATLMYLGFEAKLRRDAESSVRLVVAARLESQIAEARTMRGVSSAELNALERELADTEAMIAGNRNKLAELNELKARLAEEWGDQRARLGREESAFGDAGPPSAETLMDMVRRWRTEMDALRQENQRLKDAAEKPTK